MRSPSGSDRPTAARPRVLLLCPEALGAMARCVEDSLRARGYTVRLEEGRRARRFIRRAPAGPATLRILCVPSIEPEQASRLRRGVDREDYGDFHILGMDTPRTVVNEIERLSRRGCFAERPRSERPPLLQPTLIEQQLVSERRWRNASATVVLSLALGVFAGMLVDSTASSGVRPVAPTVSKEVIERAMIARAQLRQGIEPRLDDVMLTAISRDRPDP